METTKAKLNKGDRLTVTVIDRYDKSGKFLKNCLAVV